MRFAEQMPATNAAPVVAPGLDAQGSESERLADQCGIRRDTYGVPEASSTETVPSSPLDT
jgi:hypothetical protein